MAKGGNNGKTKEQLSEKDRNGLYRMEKERRRLEKEERRQNRDRWDDDGEDDD
jgi:hypothetical protein